MWEGKLYIIPIVIISILYNITKFLEIRTDPLYFAALRLNVSIFGFTGHFAPNLPFRIWREELESALVFAKTKISEISILLKKCTCIFN